MTDAELANFAARKADECMVYADKVGARCQVALDEILRINNRLDELQGLITALLDIVEAR